MISEFFEYVFGITAAIGEAAIKLRQEPTESKNKDIVYISSGRVVVEGLSTKSFEFPVSEYVKTPDGIVEKSFMTDGASYDKNTVKERIVSSNELSPEVLNALNELPEISA